MGHCMEKFPGRVTSPYIATNECGIVVPIHPEIQEVQP